MAPKNTRRTYLLLPQPNLKSVKIEIVQPTSPGSGSRALGQGKQTGVEMESLEPPPASPR